MNLAEFYVRGSKLTDAEIETEKVEIPFEIDLKSLLLILGEVKRLKKTSYQNFALFTLAQKLEFAIKCRSYEVKILNQEVDENIKKLF